MKLISSSSLALLIVVFTSSNVNVNALLTPTRQSVVTASAKVVPHRQYSSSLELAAEEIPRGGAVTGAAGGAGEEQVGTGTATIPNEVFNLVKSIVGAGVLSLPAGIAAFGNAPSAVIPAAILIAFMGAISAYTFQLIARVCQATNTVSYSDAWDEAVGKKSSFIVAFSCFIDCFAGNLSYSMILADTFVNLMATVGVAVTRTQSLMGVTGAVLLPLCLLKNLNSLAPFSLVGIMGMLYTALAMGFRYFAGSYAEGGAYLATALAPPAFGTAGVSAALSPQSLILMCMLSNAYIAHFNAPKFFNELKDNTMARFNKVIAWSFGSSIFLYSVISALGFLTFGSASNGLILNNYSTQDAVMSLSRIAVAISITFSYPLIFAGTRDGLLDFFKVAQPKRDDAMLNKLTIGILAVVTAMASQLTDLGLVASVGGATFGTALVFIYPAIMFIKTQNGKKTAETTICKAIAILGVIMGAIGTKLSIQ